MFETALFPLNFNEPTARIDEMLAFLTHFGTREVILLHAVEFGAGASGRAERRLRRVADRASGQGFDSRVLLRNGSAASEIVTVAGEEAADFIVFSWKRKSWIQRSILGSTTKDVIRLTDRPVFVHKATRAVPAEGEMAVLYATNFRHTDAAVSPYLRTSGLTAHRLHLLNVGERAPDPAAERNRRAEVEANLSRLSGEFSENFDEIDERATVGHPRREIVREARRVDADLIVLGKADTAGGLGSVLGSTAEDLPHSARCSVLIIPRR